MKGGSLLYKCRMCGKVAERVHVPQAYGWLAGFLNCVDRGTGAGRLFDFHSCGDRKTGLMDLIGIREDE
jgi:hypothetical protein